jgi:HSP20 family protein
MYNTVFDELFNLNREMNRIFSQAGMAQSKWPESNLYENKDEYILVSKVPGISKDKIEISLKDNSLQIKGSLDKQLPKDYKVLLEERAKGSFERNILLNEKIDVENIKAETSNGLLMIKLPKSPESKPKKITIA